MKNNYAVGLSGEECAERFLCDKGFRLIARRYRAADGEIDLIMQEGETIVFTEVKSRPSSVSGSGLQAVTAAKMRRMTHAAISFLVAHQLTERSVRFDVVEISRDGIIHIPNAFPAYE